MRLKLAVVVGRARAALQLIRWRRTGSRAMARERRLAPKARPGMSPATAAWLMVEPALKQWMCSRPGAVPGVRSIELEARPQIGIARGFGMARSFLRRDTIGPQRDPGVEVRELGPPRPSRRRSRWREITASKP